jgi:hypothetical protein
VSRWRFLGLPLAVGGVGTLVVACVELSGPQEDLSSITPISVAWPSVVAGDVLRDIAGVEAPLHLDVFDGDGNAITDATVNFIVLDQGVSIDDRGVVHGVTTSPTPVRIVAQVRRGNDILQTPEIDVDVVPRPDSIDPARDVALPITDVPLTDPAPLSLPAMEVKVISRANGNAGVKSWLVRYEILREPVGNNGERTALFTEGGVADATVSFDTTDGNGLASRTIAIQRLALAQTGVQEVRVLVTVGNTRPGGRPTMFFITLPILVPEQ